MSFAHFPPGRALSLICPLSDSIPSSAHSNVVSTCTTQLKPLFQVSDFQMGLDPSETLLSSSQPGPQQQRSTQLPAERLSGTSASPGSSDLILSLFPHRPLLSLLSQVSSSPFFPCYTTAMVEVPTGSDCGHCLLSTHSQGKHSGWGVNSHLFYSCCCPSNRNKAREE